MLFSQMAKDWFLSYFTQSTDGTGKVQISGGAKNKKKKKKEEDSLLLPTRLCEIARRCTTLNISLMSEREA